jgi:hypothetical protein
VPITKQITEYNRKITDDKSNASHYVYSNQTKVEERDSAHEGTSSKNPGHENFETNISSIQKQATTPTGSPTGSISEFQQT